MSVVRADFARHVSRHVARSLARRMHSLVSAAKVRIAAHPPGSLGLRAGSMQPPHPQSRPAFSGMIAECFRVVRWRSLGSMTPTFKHGDQSHQTLQPIMLQCISASNRSPHPNELVPDEPRGNSGGECRRRSAERPWRADRKTRCRASQARPSPLYRCRLAPFGSFSGQLTMWPSRSSSGTSFSLCSACERTETPAVCTVAESPETSGCHQ